MFSLCKGSKMLCEGDFLSKICIKCGNTLPSDTAKFCPKCGASQASNTPADNKAVQPSGQSTVQTKKNTPQSATLIGHDKRQEEPPVKQVPSHPSTGNAETKKSEKLSMSAEEYVNTISDIKLKEILRTLISPFTYGFKGIFVGNRGSRKEEAYIQLKNTLVLAGKIKDEKIEFISFNNMPKEFEPNRLYIITDLQTAVNYLFNLDDFSNESAGNQRKYQDLLERLIHAPYSCYIVLDGTNVECKGFVTLDPKIPFLFNTNLTFPDLNNDEIYDAFYKEIPTDYKGMVTEQYKTEFISYLDRNRRFYPFNNLDLANYLAGECAKKGELVIPAERHQTKSLDELFDSIIGMDNVKKKLVELNNYLAARVMMEEHGAVLPPFSLNMMFLGNPGVGKTSIARIVAKILFDLGYIREEKLIECTSKDLVSAYSGLTGVKTNRVISRAMGGVLFIDEAYALSNSCGQAGAEAIAILIKAMEDFRGEMVVMFAGYTAEMDDFVKSNSGIESRISYNFSFNDYTVDELLEIFKLKLRKTNMTITDEGLLSVRNVLKLVAGRRNFGNGRFVDKMLQAVLTKHASLNLDSDEVMQLRKESIPTIDEIMQSIK